MDFEPIAIVGIGCRLPGAKNKEAFWHLLAKGMDAITEVPATRWDIESFYDPNPATEDKMNSRWGGFLEQVDQFDAQFFGISPREAGSIDPQQRLLLEVSWEALEDAGRAVDRLAGEPVGVFMGISSFDYDKLRFQNPVNLDAYTGTGTTNCIAANRISYTFDFTGPSIAVDTACSSSLVAVHLACQSLNNGESTLALAGGVHILLSPWVTVAFAKAGFLAPDGRCKTFDSRANGYVRSEGAGVVVLKPLSKAIDSGDRIYAVLRGSAVNQDGRSNGLTAPNPQAQSEVIREAYRIAGVSPSRVQYIEAHGTGTKLGDPMEMKALGKVLSVDRPPGQYCAVGSVKTNIGHTEAAAGIAGLIKVALSLYHRQIPPSLHFQQPNPYIPFDKLSLKVQQTLEPWPDGVGTALAGVSSFGFGGTNAHVVLSEAPVLPQLPPSTSTPVLLHLLTLSAKTQAALQQLARDYLQHLAANPDLALADICFTANTGRSHFQHRLSVCASDTSEVCEKLAGFLGGQQPAGLYSGQSQRFSKAEVVGSGVSSSSLQPGHSDWQQMLQSLGTLYVQGVKVNWAGFYQDYPQQRVSLPTYPFQRQRYWFETDKNAPITPNRAQTPIALLLHQGETLKLIEQLNTAGSLSEDEVKLLPKLVELLVNKHQQQLMAGAISTNDRLSESNVGKSQELLIAYLQAEVAKVLGLEPSQLPTPTQGFFDMGMDSMMAVELKNRLEVTTGCSLPATLALELSTIKELAEYLYEVMNGQKPENKSNANLPKDELQLAEVLSKVEQLSEDGVEASIPEELAKLENLLRGN